MASSVTTSTVMLTKEQENFLEECALEFSDRFTDADADYKKIYDSGIPDPPIMCPWFTRTQFNRDRDRGGGDGHNQRRDGYRRDFDRQPYRDRRYRPY